MLFLENLFALILGNFRRALRPSVRNEARSASLDRESHTCTTVGTYRYLYSLLLVVYLLKALREALLNNAVLLGRQSNSSSDRNSEGSQYSMGNKSSTSKPSSGSNNSPRLSTSTTASAACSIDRNSGVGAPAHPDRQKQQQQQQQQQQKLRLRQADRIVRRSLPEIVMISRLAYLALALVCYSVLQSVWLEHDVFESSSSSSSLVNLHDHLQELQDTIASGRRQTLTQQQHQQHRPHQDGPKIAFVVTVTSCGGHKGIPFEIIEGAAVLRYSVAQNLLRYNYEMYALYHPDAVDCASTLQQLGYTVLARDTPVVVTDIRGDILRERIVNNGCCGEKELIKLEAFTLTDHPVVVLMDLDVLVMKPMDHLIDFILDPTKLPDRDNLLWRKDQTTIPETIDLLYTTDYAMVNPGRKVKPTQGGFVILRPNRTIYDEFVEVIKEGDFRDTDGAGWGGKTGKFWGAMTFQGLIPYYFQVLHPNRAVELNWCVWNNMCSPSRDKGVDSQDQPAGDCFTQQENCEDCRNRPVTDVALTHFTVCQKPWLCHGHDQNKIASRLCRDLHHAWFEMRSSMEISWGRSGWGTGLWNRDHFRGYCSSYGKAGYQAIEKPYGLPLTGEAGLQGM